MSRSHTLLTALLLVSATAALFGCATAHERILEQTATMAPDDYIVVTPDGTPVAPEELHRLIADAEVVYVGERHDQPAHHRLQADIAGHLLTRGPVVIAAEMFSWQQQPTLDAYSTGALDADAFQAAIDWPTTWGFPWAIYAPVLTLAEHPSGALIGLNAPKGLSSSVFKLGADNLDPEDKALLPPQLDTSNTAYREYLAAALSGHMKNPPDPADPAWQAKLDRFMQAQLVWDESMAHTLTQALLQAEPETRFVVLAGAGHVQYGWGIPSRVQRERPETRAFRIVCLSLKPDTPPEDLADELAPEIADLFCVSRQQGE